MSSDGEREKLSWDAASEGAPERPTFTASIVAETPLNRPRRLAVGLALVLLALACTIALITTAALRLTHLQDALIAALPEDLAADYVDDDLRHATLVLLSAVGGAWLALTVVQALSFWQLFAARGKTGRAVFVVSAALAVPVATLALILRDGDTPGLALTITVLAALLAAVVISCTAPVSAWLGQNIRPRAQPIADSVRSRDGDERSTS